MKYRTLGRTGLRVSEVGFGAWAIGGNAHGNSYGPTDDAVSRAAVRRALELGCNFFDTADVYGHGHSERLLGAALSESEAGKNAIVATKVGSDFYAPRPSLRFDPEYVESACEKSLERLRREAIDLYQLHNPPLSIIEREETYAALERLREQGKIRYYGISVHRPEEGLAAIRVGRAQTLQLVYNVARREMEAEVFPAARKQELGIVAREPLGNGFLVGKYDADARFPEGDIRHDMPRAYVDRMAELGRQIRAHAEHEGITAAQAALSWVLREPAVGVVIAGAKTPAHVEDNLSASAVRLAE